MAFKKNEFQQISFTDTFDKLSARNKRIMEKSWANGFAKYVFQNIKEERFSVLYSSQKFSRPNTPVNVVIGSLMIKEMFGLTDDELIESILFDTRFQYALHTTSFKEQPISDRTFSRFRERLYRYEEKTGVDLLKEEMLSLADIYTKFLSMNTTLKRMDSIMISSNCKRMSRLELIYTCVADMVQLVHSVDGDYELKDFQKYLNESNRNNIIYRSKPEEATGRIENIVADAVKLLDITEKEYSSFKEYQMLIRCINEQSENANGSIVLK